MQNLPSHSSGLAGHAGHLRSKSNLPSRAATPSSSQITISEEPTKLSHRLKHLFDHTKTANFQVSVIIHSLTNVPQLSGEFAVDWKFRGKAPRAKDAEAHAMRSKPSLPNLKMHTIHPSPSSSNLSVQTSSAGSSPATPQYPTSIHSMQIPSRAGTPSIPDKTNSTPIVDKLTSLSNRPHKAATDPPRLDRKSEPTPLRESIGPVRFTAASPEIMSQYENDESSPDMLHPDRARDIASESGSGSAGQSSLDKKGLLPPPMMEFRSQTSSNYSSSTQLDTPFSRPPLRSGTGPSVSVILDSLPGREESSIPQRPKQPSRSASYGSSIDGSTSSTDSPLERRRSTSSPMPSKPILSKASSRKGSTQVSSLRAHTCVWNFELQQTLKIPLGKPIPVSGTATPRIRGAAPVVGAGEFSESGLRLIIQQYPSKSATNASPAVGDEKGMASVIHAVHHVHHSEGKNPSERNSGNAESHKTIFGTVDVDLAAFAGKGKTTRSFLLRGSRTNATIKLTVDMRWVGGEERWAAPPMQEGHHVTRMRDLIGEPEERVKADLAMARTPSNGSSNSSLLSSRSRSNASINCDTYHAGKSCVSLAAGNPQTGYKSFEHHLRSDSTTDGTDSKNQSSAHSAQDMVRKHTLRHRAHQSRHFKQAPSQHHPFSMDDIAPDLIIEAIFNPRPSTESTPFTYVPEPGDRAGGISATLQKPDAILETLFRGMDEEHGSIQEEDKEEGQRAHREGRSWGLRAMKAKREKKASTAST